MFKKIEEMLVILGKDIEDIFKRPNQISTNENYIVWDEKYMLWFNERLDTAEGKISELKS